MLKSVLLSALLAGASQSFAANVITVKAINGQSVQVALDEIENGVRASIAAGGLVSADSILPNADGSFALNKPRILAAGKMARISPGGSGSNAQQVCVYFGFQKVVGNGFYDGVPRGETVADVDKDGTVTVGSSQSAILQINCK